MQAEFSVCYDNVVQTLELLVTVFAAACNSFCCCFILDQLCKGAESSSPVTIGLSLQMSVMIDALILETEK